MRQLLEKLVEAKFRDQFKPLPREEAEKRMNKLILSIDPHHKFYTNTIPPGSKIIGWVSNRWCNNGALVQLENGVYVMVNYGKITSLNQKDVQKSLDDLQRNGVEE